MLKSTHTIFCDQAALCDDLRARDEIPDLVDYFWNEWGKADARDSDGVYQSFLRYVSSK